VHPEHLRLGILVELDGGWLVIIEGPVSGGRVADRLFGIEVTAEGDLDVGTNFDVPGSSVGGFKVVWSGVGVTCGSEHAG